MSTLQAHVLIVDDEPSIRRTFSRLLQQDGHQIMTAGSIAEARAALSRAPEPPVDLVISDVVLPDGSGAELAQAAFEPVDPLDHAAIGLRRRAAVSGAGHRRSRGRR